MDKSPADNALVQIAFSVPRFVPQMRFAKAVSAKKRSSVCAFSHFGEPFLTSTFTMPGRYDRKKGTRVPVIFFSAAQQKLQTTIFAASDKKNYPSASAPASGRVFAQTLSSRTN